MQVCFYLVHVASLHRHGLQMRCKDHNNERNHSQISQFHAVAAVSAVCSSKLNLLE